MSQQQGIEIRFHAAEADDGASPEPFTFGHAEKASKAYASVAYAAKRPTRLPWFLVFASLTVSLITLGYYRAAHEPFSLRVPLVQSSSAFAPSGDWPASISDIFGQDALQSTDQQALTTPPKQELLGALPDTSIERAELAAPPPAALLTIQPGNGEAEADHKVHIIGSGEIAPAEPSPHPAKVVKRGTFISAILETPVEPGTPSGVRALVPSHVAGLKQGLGIPKSTRLIGQYYSQMSAGRPRVYIIWKQLTLPDGSVRNLPSGSIAKDKFFDSFGSASMISVFSADEKSGTLGRIRTGEALVVVTAKDVDLTEVGEPK